ncbi:hypothetical protein [Varibaculum massiliense]|uniref:hypothetical protein n=1 Tax=Varibaculum massiliense TaxID=1852372 RepID=UPI002889FAFE|nr:hypothetical protein [Varibaculum massiliense]
MIPTKISPLITPKILFAHRPTLLGFFPGLVTFELFLSPGLELLDRKLFGWQSFFTPKFFFEDALFLAGLPVCFLLTFPCLPAGFILEEDTAGETLPFLA